MEEIPIQEEVESAYLTYSMSVIVSRALPDVRDGLKPVQRRILYSMGEMGLRHDRPHRKSARIVGEVLGKYHPHGDAAVYDALVRMAQPFTTRYPLVDGQGNFGSIDGDPPAAMRYTEARLSEIGEEMLKGLEEGAVDMVPNFDASTQEPEVLPARFPLLLANGAQGIAVGVSTMIPPHNLRELGEALTLLLHNPEATVEEVMEIVKGPDFPTGGIVLQDEGLERAYRTGRGRITVKGVAEIEGRNIVIKEIPYTVNKADLVREIAEKAEEGKIKGVSYVRDESDKRGLRIFVAVKRGFDPRDVLAELYDRTNLQIGMNVVMLVIRDLAPVLMDIREIMLSWIAHRLECIRRQAEFRLSRNRERAHVLEGLIRAVEMIDEVVALIKGSRDPEEAKRGLVERMGFTEAQARAILDMRLQRLTALSSEELRRELEKLRELIERDTRIATVEEERKRVLEAEIREIVEKYGDPRRTRILRPRPEEAMVILADGKLIVSRKSILRRERFGEIAHIHSGAGRVIAVDRDGTVWFPKRRRVSARNAISAYVATEGTLIAVSPEGYAWHARVEELEEGSKLVPEGFQIAATELLCRGDRLAVITREGRIGILTTLPGNGERAVDFPTSGDGVAHLFALRGDEEVFVVLEGGNVRVEPLEGGRLRVSGELPLIPIKISRKKAIAAYSPNAKMVVAIHGGRMEILKPGEALPEDTERIFVIY